MVMIYREMGRTQRERERQKKEEKRAEQSCGDASVYKDPAGQIQHHSNKAIMFLTAEGHVGRLIFRPHLAEGHLFLADRTLMGEVSQS